MLAAKCGESALLHAARDFLERISAADGGKVFVEKLVCSRQRRFFAARLFPCVR